MNVKMGARKFLPIVAAALLALALVAPAAVVGAPEVLATRTSVSQIYRVRQGERPINEKSIIGAVEAFAEYKLDGLFCIAPDRS